MTERIRLQKFDHHSSSYERPDRAWICGHADEGIECRLGPDGRGRCRAAAVCAPMRRGSSWVCTRAAEAGGPCSEGPLPDGRCCRQVPPCVPRRSSRAKERSLVLWAFAVTLGIVALGLAPVRRADFASPGSLTTSHGGVHDCSSCHANWNDGVAGWFRSARASPVPDRACLACHDVGANPALAHGLPAARLSEWTNRALPPETWSLARARQEVAGPTDPHSAPPCSVCHAEHGGADADLREVADARCQTCHVRTFASFSSGHPEFGTYPSTEATALVYDHLSHFGRHFSEERFRDLAPLQCGDCHYVDVVGERMLVRPFEESCGSCHGSQIDGVDRPGGTRGLVVLDVPGLDEATLRAHGLDVGSWPWAAEGRGSPFLSLLLDEDGRVAAEALEDVDPLDLSGEDDATLVAAARFARSVKRLYGDLVFDGAEVAADRLRSRIGGVRDSRLPDLLRGLQRETVSVAVDGWFPALEEELGRWEAGDGDLRPRPPGSAETELASPDRDAPSPPLDGPLLGQDEDIPAAGGSDDDLLGTGDDLLSGDDDLLSGDDDLSGDGGTSPAGGDDLLGGASPTETEDLLAGGDDLLSGEDDDLLSADDGDLHAESDDLLGSEDDLLTDGSEEGDDLLLVDDGPGAGGDDLLLGAAGPPIEEEDLRPPPPATPPRESVSPEQWVRRGGWFVEGTAILYRPSGHPDRFLSAWLDLVAPLRDDPTADHLFERLVAADAPGACGKCHSVAESSAERVVRWRPAAQERARSRLTRFPHASHFTVAFSLDVCGSCHRLRPDADVLSSWEDRDPSTFVPAFEASPRELCASCHGRGGVGETCTGCHLYHTGVTIPTPAPLALISAARDVPPTEPAGD